MNSLETNVTTLAATTRTIKWYQYRCSYRTTDATGSPVVVSICRQLLDARIPCIWRPAHRDTSTDNALYDAIESIARCRHPDRSSQPRHTADIPDQWEVWVFHAAMPEEQAAELVRLPAGFQVITSGDIAWKSAGDNGSHDEIQADSLNAGSPGEEHGLLHQALANLMDRALLPLSVVRFGVDQWVALEDSPLLARLGSDDRHDSALAADDMRHFSLPPTPPYSSDADLTVDATEFLLASAKYTTAKHPANNAAATDNSQKKPRAVVLQFTTSVSTNGLLVQSSIEAVDSIEYMGSTQDFLDSQRHRSEASDSQDPKQLSTIAHVWLAPYGVPAQIVSVPKSHMGDSEDKVIEAWSRAFGYPKSLLAACGAKSALVYIRLATGEQPMLYPRRLAFLDNDVKVHATSESENTCEPDNTGMTNTGTHANDAASTLPIPSRPMELGDASSEPEEGEEREDGEDEDGEIADPVVIEPVYDERASAMDAEFDAMISQLRNENTQSVEQSLAAIRETMVGFQAELRVEEEEEHKRKEKERLEALAAQRAANAAAQAAKRSNSASKHDVAGNSGTRKRQRSKSRDEGSKKSRKKSEPAVVLPTKTSAPADPPAPAAAAAVQLPVDQQPKTEVVANGTVGDIGSTNGGSGTDGLFGNLGDDMGLDLDMGMGISGMGGMGMNMDMDMDMDMDSMANGMFGVTDDDFSFFDTVPATQPPDISATSLPDPSPPAQPVASVVKSEFTPTTSYQPSMDLGMLSTSASGSGIDAGSSLVGGDNIAGRDLADTALGGGLDDLFGDDDDDGMFDSFFGSSTTAATAAVTATATATAANATVTTEVPAVTANDTIVKLETDPTDDALAANSTDETGPPGPLTLSLASPHEGLLTGSISVNSMSSGTAPESTATAVSAADLASPGSYKLTPAPSADMQTPVQTPLVPFPNKGVEPADEVVLPRTISNTAAQGYSATQPAASLSAPAPLPMVPPASQPAAFRTQKQSTTPLPYSSIATPYDDIGRHAQSWLQDRPTPAQLTGDISDLNPQELDPHNIRFTSIMEKSLNPVSWIKRISARRMHQTGSRVKGQTPKSQPRRHSSVTSRSHIAGSSAPASLRRLRGWLVAYKAKSSYSKDFVPRHISMTGSALAASGSASAEADVLVPSTSISADAMSAAGDGHLPGETTGSNAPQSAGASAVGGSQQVHNTGSERADNAPMGVLEAITTAEGTHHDKSEAASDDRLFGAVSRNDHRQGFLSFTSIINPRQPAAPASRIGQSLETRAAELGGAVTAPSSLGYLGLPAESAQQIYTTTVTVIDGARVPWLLLQAHGILELMHALPPKAPMLSWSVAASSAIRLAMSPAATVGCVYSADLPVARSPHHSCIAEAIAPHALLTAGSLGARLGGLLLSRPLADIVSSDAIDGNANSQLSVFGCCNSEIAFAGQWGRAMRQQADWPATVEMLADWAINGLMLQCLHSADRQQASVPRSRLPDAASSNVTPVCAGDISNALVHFWHPTDDTISNAESGQLTLGKLLALDSAPPPQSATAKYRGFVIKKRKSTTQVVGASKGSVVVPSGPGVIEPLLEPHVLVGAHAQQDIGLPATSLTTRDSESLYIKRWHYEHRLASSARHQARVAAGEIEETEEGEEREDGEDDVSVIADDQLESSEDWTDPDAHTADAEDVLRRACISTKPLALRWWVQMQMRPIGASKDVRWCAFIPPMLPNDSPSDPADWCRASKAAADRFLSDVDTAYHGMHMGTHIPLNLAGILDGIFTQLTDDNSALAMGPGSISHPAPQMQWRARLRFEATRLGRCAAHSWYISCQQTPQRKPAAAEQQPAAPTPSLVIYMLVPFAHRPEPWVAMADSAQLIVSEFGRSLSSLIARTAVRSGSMSSSMADSHVPWPTLAVHPLPLDQIAKWNSASRDSSVPSIYDTALAIYNKLPEPLAPPTMHSTASPSMSSLAAPSLAIPAMLSRQGSAPTAATAAKTPGAMQFVRHAGFFEYVATDRPTMPRGFAHQAAIVSSATTFPTADSAIVPATIPLTLAMQRSDMTAEDSHTVPANQSNMPISSLYPQLPSESPLGARQASSSSETANELPEVRVRFGAHKTITAGDFTTLVAHPLRPCDTMTTLHCAYTNIGEWVAVCWCDERGEYVDHAVFVNQKPGLSADVQCKVWEGCAKFRRLFGGQLRVVLCEWCGMSPEQASSWRTFISANPLPYIPAVHLVSAGVNPRTGLCLFSSTPTPSPTTAPAAATAADQMASSEQDMPQSGCHSLVLQSQMYVEFTALHDRPLHMPRALLPTAYMIMHRQQAARLPLRCVCIQMLDADNDLLIVRAIAKQFHQLAAARSQPNSYALPMHIDAVNAVREALQLVI